MCFWNAFANLRLWLNLPEALEYVPARHWVQFEALRPPEFVMYVPGTQGTHTNAPQLLVNVPAEHKLQFEELEAPVMLEYVPAKHRLHATEPSAPAGTFFLGIEMRK